MATAAASLKSATLLSASQGPRNPKAAEILQRGYHTTAVRHRGQRRLSGNLRVLLVCRTRIENCCRRLGAASLHISKLLQLVNSARIVSIEQLCALLPKTAAEALGVEIASVDSEHIVLRMPMSDRARQPLGLLHGGISMVLAETAASLHACWEVDLARSVPVGIEINGSHIRSAADGHILAKASLVRRSSKLIVHTVEISHQESGRALCLARVTNFYK